MRIPLALAAAVLLLGLPLQVLADVVVLNDGYRVSGKLSNRQRISEHSALPTTVAIFEGSIEDGKLHRFPRDQVDYVLLEDDGDVRVIEASARTSGKPTVSTDSARSQRVGDIDGALPIVLGAAILVFAIAKPVGEAEASLTESGSLEVKEHTHNMLNYAGMALGGALVIGGIISLEAKRSQEHALGPAAASSGPGIRIGFGGTF